ncbi:sulfurtransferase TusA family protein [Salinispirillum sp. LH 10-3-1]|uniref:Sulfurtransferase TusA family protein n=1 Tax=Salinispirillum sp. LH 10-3-1 TaxID=2952525 RepID=A0AB38YDX1_9GAMM
MTTNITETTIDASQLACPLPLLKVKQWLAKAAVGGRLRIITTDPGSKRDIPRFLASTSHTLIAQEEAPSVCIFIIQAGASNA